MNDTLRSGVATASRSRTAMLSLLAGGVVWGLSWLPLHFFAAAGIGGHLVGLTGYAFVAACAIPLIWLQRSRWRGEGRTLLWIGICFGCSTIAFTMAVTTGSVVRAMLLFYLLPAWGAIGGALFLHERLGPRRLLAVGLSLCGVFVILGGTNAWDVPLSIADGMALVAGLGYTAGGIFNRKAGAIPQLSRALSTFIGCAVAAAVALLFSRPVFPDVVLSIWVLLALFAGVWLLGATLLTTYGLTRVDISRASVLQVVELLVAIISAILLGNELLTPKEYIGGALIIAATVIEATTA